MFNKGFIPCAQLKGLNKLTFLDGTYVMVQGLEEIFAGIYAEGRQIDSDTAEEIVNRLERKNYIPSSARQEYRRILLKEYRGYVAAVRNEHIST